MTWNAERTAYFIRIRPALKSRSQTVDKVILLNKEMYILNKYIFSCCSYINKYIGINRWISII